MFGIAFQTNHPLQAYGALASQAESYNFDRIALFNDLLYQPVWLPLMQMALHTERIEIGPTAVNPFICHPINIAGHLSLLNQVAAGRIYLGFARGAWLDVVGIRPPRPITALHEAISAIDHLLARHLEPLSGDIFPVQGGETFRWGEPIKNIPFRLATWGPKTVRKCIKSIDAVRLGGTANPDAVRWMRHLIDQAASDVGRNPDEIKVVVGLTTMLHQDSQFARQVARREVVQDLAVIADLDPTLEIEPEILNGIREATAQHDDERAASYISDELLDKFAVSGTPEEIIRMTHEIMEAGAAHVDFFPLHGETATEGMRLLGEKVLPVLRKERSPAPTSVL